MARLRRQAAHSVDHARVGVLPACVAAFIVLVSICCLSSAAAAATDSDDLRQRYDSTQFLPIVWSAPFLSGGGYCSEAISFALSLAPFFGSHMSLSHHGDAYSGKFVSGLDQHTLRTLQPMFHRAQKSGAIAICHSEPGAWDPPRYQTSLCPEPDARIKIGRTMFETDRLPKGWSDRLNKMDYVWVPTAFHRDVFAAGGVDPQKLVVIPEPVDTDFFSPDNAAQMEPFIFPGEGASGAKRPFRFLSIFKWEERKGWQVLLEAFLREFATESAEEPTPVLYILTSAYHSDADFQDRIDSFTSTLSWPNDVRPSHLPSVRLIESGISSIAMLSLYAGADAFVLPSRGEGWGRPHVEAMSMSLPLIATEWSGPSEFMTHENSYPLRTDELVPILEGAFRGHKWSQPSIAHLRELMREVVRDPAAARIKGMRARDDMVSRYCQACVARFVVDELARIQSIRPRDASDASRSDTDEQESEQVQETQAKDEL